MLEERGLIVRTPDPGDGRRIYLALSFAARSAVLDWLEAVGP